MAMKAVIDRFEGDFAVLSIGDGERRLEARRDTLPEECQEGTWLQIELDGDVIVKVDLDLEETARTHDRIAEKLARLRRGEHHH